MDKFDIPVLLITYNRADTTARVLDCIAAAKPAVLFIASNSPNPDKNGDLEKVMNLRSMLEEKVNWTCRVEKLYRTEHLTAGKSIFSAIKWFFDNVEEGIILEDDTMPHPSFFSYCRELLAYYRNDEAVRMVSGNNFQDGKTIGDGSYYFSGYIHSWGYATWRRVWENYNFELNQLDDSGFENLLNNRFNNSREKDYWRSIYKNLRKGMYATWDFQFLFMMWQAGGMCIIPNRNLVTNIGFGNNATHTTSAEDPASNLPLGEIKQIIHPSQRRIAKEADQYFFRHYLQETGKWEKRFRRMISIGKRLRKKG